MYFNDISRKKIAEYLEVSSAFVSKVCSGNRSLPQDKVKKILENPFGWDISPLYGTNLTQTIGDHSNNNTQSASAPDSEMWRKLCEEKDKRIAELERTIQILLKNGQ